MWQRVLKFTEPEDFTEVLGKIADINTKMKDFEETVRDYNFEFDSRPELLTAVHIQFQEIEDEVQAVRGWIENVKKLMLEK